MKLQGIQLEEVKLQKQKLLMQKLQKLKCFCSCFPSPPDGVTYLNGLRPSRGEATGKPLARMQFIEQWLSGLGLDYVIPRLKEQGITTPKKLAALTLKDMYELCT